MGRLLLTGIKYHMDDNVSGGWAPAGAKQTCKSIPPPDRGGHGYENVFAETRIAAEYAALEEGYKTSIPGDFRNVFLFPIH